MKSVQGVWGGYVHRRTRVLMGSKKKSLKIKKNLYFRIFFWGTPFLIYPVVVRNHTKCLSWNALLHSIWNLACWSWIVLVLSSGNVNHGMHVIRLLPGHAR